MMSERTKEQIEADIALWSDHLAKATWQWIVKGASCSRCKREVKQFNAELSELEKKEVTQ